MSLTWTEKYRPENISEVVGQTKAIQDLKKFIDSFSNQKNKAILLYGPPGCGKTSIISALSNEYNLEVIELNASDLRNKKSIENLFGAASKQASLINKSKILLADEIDGLSGTDRGGITALIKIIKETNFPIILTANDPYSSKLRNLRTYCTLVKLNKLNYLSIEKKLKEICNLEKIKYNETILKKLAISSDGDLRAAINDLQTMAQGKEKITEEDLNQWSREREESIFNTLKLIFKSKDIKAAFDSADELTEDLDVLNYWLDENIYKEYRNKKENRDAYNLISLSNIFLSRIRRWQHWRFLVYSKTLSVGGVQQVKERASNLFVMYQRPKIMNWMFQQGMKRRKIQSNLKIAKDKLHASSSNLNKSFWPYYKFIKEHNKKLAEELDKWLEIEQ